jgi:hypothetical protein
MIYGRLVCFIAVWYMLLSFGTLFGTLRRENLATLAERRQCGIANPDCKQIPAVGFSPTRPVLILMPLY